MQTPRQRDAVVTQQADALFAQGRYIQAADLYAQSSKSFEHVVLSLVDRNERDALRNYLHSRLSHLRKTDLTQRMMLATWLVEIFLAKLNDLEDVAASEGASEDADNVRVERAILEDDLRDFLRSHKVRRWRVDATDRLRTASTRARRPSSLRATDGPSCCSTSRRSSATMSAY